jgi:uncharacterized membrane protein YkoI
MILRILTLLLLPTVLTACETLDFDDWIFDREQDISLSAVPPQALATAKDAVEGIEFQEASVETKKGQKIYELTGTANGQEYDVEVTAAGELIEIGSESDDD